MISARLGWKVFSVTRHKSLYFVHLVHSSLIGKPPGETEDDQPGWVRGIGTSEEMALIDANKRTVDNPPRP